MPPSRPSKSRANQRVHAIQCYSLVHCVLNSESSFFLSINCVHVLTSISTEPFDGGVVTGLQQLASLGKSFIHDHASSQAPGRCPSLEAEYIGTQKRPRADGDAPAIPYVVALRKGAAISRKFIGGHTPSNDFRLDDAKQFLKLKYHQKLAKVSVGHPQYSTLVEAEPSLAREYPALVVSLAAKTSTSLEPFCIELSPDENIEEILAASHSLGARRLSPDTPGAIIPIIDLVVSFTPGKVTLKLELEIRWNSTCSPWLPMRNSNERVATRKLIHAAFPAAEHEDLHPSFASKCIDESSHNSQASMPDITKILGNIPSPPKQSFTPSQFYEATFSPDPNDESARDIYIPGLASTLYGYQKRTLKWLLSREGVTWDGDQLVPITKSQSALLDTFRAVQDADGNECHVSDVMQLVTRDLSQWRAADNLAQGGILAEEMGLGKTLEIISLILVHQRNMSEAEAEAKANTGPCRPTRATLIVCPESLKGQWLSEFQKHAPLLKTVLYNSFDISAVGSEEEQNAFLADHDVVISTYQTFSRELHFISDAHERSFRYKKRYIRPKSPLVRLHWWRLCLDEAQIIENGYSAAAEVAQAIPRTFSWGVTGTPVMNQTRDLLGLLKFTNVAPYAFHSPPWDSLISVHLNAFKALIRKICLRHTKSQVGHEINLPPQRRYVITMPFTTVEEQYYQGLVKEMAEVCELSITGEPLYNDWDLDRHEEKMRKWLHTLRQAALHPQVITGRHPNTRTRNAETIQDVLESMLDASDKARLQEQRQYLSMRLIRGQMFEAIKEPKNALDIWEHTKKELEVMIRYSKDKLARALETKSAADIPEESDRNSDDDESGTGSSHVAEARRTLRTFLETYHKAVFLCASACYQIKEIKQKAGEPFNAWEDREDSLYQQAKMIRREILQGQRNKVIKLMEEVRQKLDQRQFTQVGDLTSPEAAGIETRNISTQVELLFEALNTQKSYLMLWREAAAKLLLVPLIDGDEDNTGDDFSESAKVQDQLSVYIMMLRTLVADREDAITGGCNMLVQREIDSAKKRALDNEGPEPLLFLDLMATRDQIKLSAMEGSLKGAISELRSLANGMAPTSIRLETEILFAKTNVQLLSKDAIEQSKLASKLSAELDLFTTTMNARIEFYREMQAFSDKVSGYESSTLESAFAAAAQNEQILDRRARQSEAHFRYLQHLHKAIFENNTLDSECPICQNSHIKGIMTTCGHRFCKECLMQWYQTHRNCPMCKHRLEEWDLHNYSVRPRQLGVHSEQTNNSGTTTKGKIDKTEDENNASSSSRGTTNFGSDAIYSTFDKKKLAEIKSVSLHGPSYTTKIDTLVRHIIWLRKSDPYSKSIVYSSYTSFLDILSRAFKTFGIGHATLGQPNAADRFRADTATEVLLLHSRAHSSGLNLVNASHVFLCEPLLNTALELQAVARVDRIGQTNETTVWLYLVDGTVEESIYRLSVKHRLQHMPPILAGVAESSSKGGRSQETNRTRLDEANRQALQNAQLGKLMSKGRGAGEMVGRDDLWECLFGASQWSENRDGQER
ncbi:putative ATP-dependent helicase [Ceratocystis fimbriata CBS 114723]|uniref:Putative ATP-dependent helicase n=1 Tax=Ceratocystis fimbriata CBS 114723 TaxID=1035309 RepID=A0A2C5XKZ3_9PEZI|nr:putative ATP-dependent helicase [Ceratocystis fimbriata CBS 114723]